MFSIAIPQFMKRETLHEKTHHTLCLIETLMMSLFMGGASSSSPVQGGSRFLVRYCKETKSVKKETDKVKENEGKKPKKDKTGM